MDSGEGDGDSRLEEEVPLEGKRRGQAETYQ